MLVLIWEFQNLNANEIPLDKECDNRVTKTRL